MNDIVSIVEGIREEIRCVFRKEVIFFFLRVVEMGRRRFLFLFRNFVVFGFFRENWWEEDNFIVFFWDLKKFM